MENCIRLHLKAMETQHQHQNVDDIPAVSTTTTTSPLTVDTSLAGTAAKTITTLLTPHFENENDALSRSSSRRSKERLATVAEGEATGAGVSDDSILQRVDGTVVSPRTTKSVTTTPRSGTLAPRDEGEEGKKAGEGEEGGWKVGPEDFTPMCVIGQGAFGRVLQVRSKLDDCMYAMKVISKRMLRKKNHLSYMRAERDIMTKIDFPFVVGLKFSFQTDEKLFLVMDYLSGGELFFHLRKHGLILEDTARFYVAEMVLALEHLHAKGIIHRDLKPENVLLGKDGHLCLTDFGLAKELTAPTVGVEREGEEEAGEEGGRARTVCGTNEYMCPEMILKKGYGKAADWWSLGALMYEMMAGHAPFRAKTVKELNRKILHEKLSLPPFLSSEAHAVLKGLLERNVQKRLGAARSTMFEVGGVAALKGQRFFKKIDWQLLVRKQLPAPVVPPLASDCDTSNFDEEFTKMDLSLSLVEIEGAGATHSDTFCGFSFIESSIPIPSSLPAYRLTPAAKAAARLQAAEDLEAFDGTGATPGSKKKKKKNKTAAVAAATAAAAAAAAAAAVLAVEVVTVSVPVMGEETLSLMGSGSGSSTTSSAVTSIVESEKGEGNEEGEEGAGLAGRGMAAAMARGDEGWKDEKGRQQPHVRKWGVVAAPRAVQVQEDIEMQFPPLGGVVSSHPTKQQQQQQQPPPPPIKSVTSGILPGPVILLDGVATASATAATAVVPVQSSASKQGTFSWSAVVATNTTTTSSTTTTSTISSSSAIKNLQFPPPSASTAEKQVAPPSPPSYPSSTAAAIAASAAATEKARMPPASPLTGGTGSTDGECRDEENDDGFVVVTKTKHASNTAAAGKKKQQQQQRQRQQLSSSSPIKNRTVSPSINKLNATATAYVPGGGGGGGGGGGVWGSFRSKT